MKHVNLALEDAFHAQLKIAADQDHRSLQREIVFLLTLALVKRAEMFVPDSLIDRNT